MAILSGPLIVVAGSIATMGIFAATNLRRTRKLSEDAEDLHGSARLATADDVQETGFLPTQHGVYVGGWYDETEHRLQYLRDNGPSHVLAFAPTRSGKGVSLVIPSLLIWPESCVVYDIKGENWEKTAGFRAQTGQVCFKFSPIETDGSRYNPLAEVRIFTLRDVADAQNVANIVFKTEANPKDPYWQETAASLGSGLVLHVCYTAAQQGKVACLADLSHAFTPPGIDFREALIELENFPRDPEFKLGWTTPTGERTATHPMVAEKVRQTLNKAEGLEWCGLMRDHFSCSLLRPVGTPQHRSERLSHQRPRELRAPGIALSRCSQQRP